MSVHPSDGELSERYSALKSRCLIIKDGTPKTDIENFFTDRELSLSVFDLHDKFGER